MFKIFSLLVLAAIAAGCGVKAETYVMTKDRMDIEKPANANAGYLAGAGPYLEPDKKTRKVYVLELSRPASGADKVVKEEVSKSVSERSSNATPPSNAALVDDRDTGSGTIKIPAIEDTEPSFAASGPKQATTYKVEKDDTLQKIAKKVYGNYSKWIKIYDANKDKLKNPNFVKPGTILTIPAGE